MRVVAGHKRIMAALAAMALCYPALPGTLPGLTRAIVAWDVGVAVMIALAIWTFATEGDDKAMAHNARRQQDGRWTTLGITLAAVAITFAALTQQFAATKDLPASQCAFPTILVAITLFLSWLVTHVVFAIRYAHEYYTHGNDHGPIDGGLSFLGSDARDRTPDYWDFVYFALTLGMTFQTSDVEITSRKLRRLATVHGLLSFLFNTVIVALTVNLAASLL